MARASSTILLGAVVLVLSGCGISDPYTTTSTGPSPAGRPAASEPEHDGPLPPAARPTPRAAAPSPQSALTRYAALYVNWTAATLSADERALASLSTGQAHAQALAESEHPPPTLVRYAVANAGTVVAIAQGEGTERGRWAVITDEQTSGNGPYRGLPATSHVTWATVARVAGGWLVSGWYPGS